MNLNVAVRQFRAETAKLPEIVPHPRSNVHCHANEKK